MSRSQYHHKKNPSQKKKLISSNRIKRRSSSRLTDEPLDLESLIKKQIKRQRKRNSLLPNSQDIKVKDYKRLQKK